ncbi:hydrogenase maturation protease [Sulfurimonas sp.]|uniref:hydrogenase maturation protease n=1 Tax=Sulfurimonas sp. TaxID=2022749 RepID=UPI00261D209B|nr:hydrogenase maturation protease [Sulfurimonas sp.]
MNKIAILGVGNILEKDDGIAIYATSYLEKNYTFSPALTIINGGVEGINLLNLFMEYEHIIILDAIEIDDEKGSIYHIPSQELTGYGLNSGGAHEIGVLQCFDILELMDKPIPKSSVLGIIPDIINVEIGLSDLMYQKFDIYIETLVKIIKKEGIIVTKKTNETSVQDIIEKFKNPSRILA